ncbi:hypothetical protein V6N11_045032 [Hibiscus sabdariffa]
MLTKTVEMKRDARGSVWTPRKAAVWAVKIFSRGMENTHMEVNKASPMATLITPMAAADFELCFWPGISLRIAIFTFSFSFIFIFIFVAFSLFWRDNEISNTKTHRQIGFFI